MADATQVVGTNDKGQFVVNVPRGDIERIDVVDIDFVVKTKNGARLIIPGAAMDAMTATPPNIHFSDGAWNAAQMLSSVQRVETPTTSIPAMSSLTERDMKKSDGHKNFHNDGKGQQNQAAQEAQAQQVAPLPVGGDSSLDKLLSKAAQLAEDTEKKAFEPGTQNKFNEPPPNPGPPPGLPPTVRIPLLTMMSEGNVLATDNSPRGNGDGGQFVYGGTGPSGSGTTDGILPGDALQYGTETLTGSAGSDIIYADGLHGLTNGGNTAAMYAALNTETGHAPTGTAFYYAKELAFNIAGYLRTPTSATVSGLPDGVTLEGLTSSNGVWNIPTSWVTSGKAFNIVYDVTKIRALFPDGSDHVDIKLTFNFQGIGTQPINSTKVFILRFQDVDAASDITNNDPVYITGIGKGWSDIYVMPTASAPHLINADEGDNLVYAGNSNDTINAGTGADTIYAYAGDDIISVGDGANTVWAGNGNDTVTTGSGNDVIYAGSGNNSISAGEGNNIITAGDGDDSVSTGLGNDNITLGGGFNQVWDTGGNNTIRMTGYGSVNTGNGIDTIQMGNGTFYVHTGNGKKTITIGDGDGAVTTGDGDDIVNIGSGTHVINVGDGANTVTAGSGKDTVTSGIGNDVIDVGGGVNEVTDTGGNNTVTMTGSGTVNTGAGTDTITMGDGTFKINAGGGVNTITVTGIGDGSVTTGAGDDSISVGTGVHTIDAGAGTNVVTVAGGDTTVTMTGSGTVTTGTGNDSITVGDGTFKIDAGAGTNTVTTGDGNGSVTTGSGDDSVTITSGNGVHVITLGDGTNTVTVGAGSGNDTVTGGTGNDVINVGDGANIVTASDGANTVTAGSGDDTVTTGSGDDVLILGAGFNLVTDTGGTNTVTMTGSGSVTTGAGTDTITMGAGAYTIDAGAGVNTITVTGIGDGSVTTGSGNDSITVGIGVHTILAGDGINRITAGDGNTSVTTGAGNDTVTTGSGNDVIDVGSATNIVYAGNGANTITAGTGNDTLVGGSGVDSISGGDGDDYLYGGAGSNTLLDGGAGTNDWLTFNGISSTVVNGTTVFADWTAYAGTDINGVSLTLNATGGGTATHGTDTDTVAGIENLIGSYGNDTLDAHLYTGIAHTLYGLAGNDSLMGADGADTIYGGAGNDWVMGYAGNDTIDLGATQDTAVATSIAYTSSQGVAYTVNNWVDGGTGADTIIGTVGADYFYAKTGEYTDGLGNTDDFDGGSGVDVADFSSYTSNLTITSTDAKVSGTLVARYTNIEEIITGTGADSITGTSANEIFRAGNGNNNVTSGGGNDSIFAGTGNDVLYSTAGTSNTVYFNGGSGYNEYRMTTSVDTIDGQTAGSQDRLFYNGSGVGAVISGANYGVFINMDATDYGISNAGALVSSAANSYWWTGTTWTAMGVGNSGYQWLADNDQRGFYGEAQNDRYYSVEDIYGSNYADVLIGNGSNNYFFGHGGTDAMYGLGGDDTFGFVYNGTYNTSNDYVDGGSNSALTVTLGSGTLTIAGGDSVDYTGASNFQTINLDSSAHGIAAANQIIGKSNSTTIVSTTTAYNIENAYGSNGEDIIYGNSSDNILDGRGSNDTIYGYDGNDVILGGYNAQSNAGSGADTMDGGNGTDWISYSGIAGAGYTSLGIELYLADADLNGDGNLDQIVAGTWATGTGYSRYMPNATAEIDILYNFENIVGSTVNDKLAGDSGANIIWGMNGNDIIDGGAGNDTIDGGLGNDTLYGGLGTDTLTYLGSASSAIVVNLTTGSATGGGGTDTLSGFENVVGSTYNDTLIGNSGVNILDGGTGTDMADYSYVTSSTSVVANLLTNTVVVGSSGDNDTLISIENLRGGSGNDTLTGDTNVNTIYGGAGNDSITGSGGADSLYGETGSDTFVFTNATLAAAAVISGGTAGAAETDRITVTDTWSITAGTTTTAKYVGIEEIYARNTASGDAFSLNSTDITNIVDNGNNSTLTLYLDSGDTFTFVSTNSGNYTTPAAGYNAFTNGGALTTGNYHLDYTNSSNTQIAHLNLVVA